MPRSDMTILTSEERKVPILTIKGGVDLHVVQNLQDEVERLRNESHSSLIINMSLVTRIDSSSIGTLIAIQDVYRKTEGTVILSGLSDAVRRVMELTNVTEFFLITSSDEEALQSLSAAS